MGAIAQNQWAEPEGFHHSPEVKDCKDTVKVQAAFQSGGADPGCMNSEEPRPPEFESQLCHLLPRCAVIDKS